jgi:hypothetical protein
MKWISVDKHLPEKDTWIIYHASGIFSPEGSPQMWIGQYDPDHNVFFCSRGFFGGDEVTHWMPVPELPKKTDTEGRPAEFNAGDRVWVIPLNRAATVIEQTLHWDYPESFWGNLKLQYDDGTTGTGHSWQVKPLK